MSTPTQAPSAIGPADALAASQRVQQLQTLLEQARQGSTSSFAAALQAARGSDTAGEPTTPPSASAAPLTSAVGSPAPLSSVGSAAPAPLTALSSAPTPTTAGGSPYDALVAQSAARHGIDPALLHGLIQQESGFDPNSRSSAGALGLTQLMPGTASSLGVADPLDPAQSIEGGARYLSEMLQRFGGNTTDALAAYNAGPGAVQRYGGVPPYAETQDYVAKVLGYADAYRQAHGSTTLAPLTPSGRGLPAGTGAIA